MKKSILLISILLLTVLYPLTYADENIDNTDSIKGRVILEFVVTKEGKVIDPVVIKSVPKGVFDEAALEAVKKLRFKPPTERGVPVEAIITFPMKFEMSAIEFKAHKASNEGIKHLRNGEYESALADFNAAIGIAPEDGRYYELRGQVYHEMKNYQKAVDDYSKAIKKDPKMFNAYFSRGQVLQKLGKPTEAIDDYTRAIDLDEDSVQAYNNRAVSYKKLNDIGNMCIDLKKACELGDCRGLEIAQYSGKCTDDVAN